MSVVNKLVRLVKDGAVVSYDVEKRYPIAHVRQGYNSEGDEIEMEVRGGRPGTYVTRGQSVMVVGNRKQLRSWLGKEDYNAALQLEKEQAVEEQGTSWWMADMVDVDVPENLANSNNMFQPGEHIDTSWLDAEGAN